MNPKTCAVSSGSDSAGGHGAAGVQTPTYRRQPLNAKPETPNPKPETLNPELQTPNPKPSAPNTVVSK